MRVAAEISQGLERSAERRLGINHPFGPAQRGQKGGESARFGQRFEFSEELQVAVLESLFEGFEKQSPEEFGQHLNREKEARTAGNPALVVRREPAAGNDTVQMGMVQQVLPP